MPVNNYKDLVVWQKSMDLVEQVYRLTSNFPKEEKYALTDQLKRAVVSVPSNIAEGQQRATDKDFAKFLSIARGSNAEVQTQLEIAIRLGYLTSESILETMELSEEIARMLSSFISKLVNR